MEEISWMQMLAYRQELRHFFRELLVQGQNQILTASELELLSLLYVQTEERTPLALSRRSGMKKEAVSRCLKQLFEAGYIEKNRHPQDERSYILSLTERGRQALRASYGPILQPMYDLRRSMGAEFDRLFQLIERANAQLEERNK